jgi:hypothetical protein
VNKVEIDWKTFCSDEKTHLSNDDPAILKFGQANLKISIAIMCLIIIQSRTHIIATWSETTATGGENENIIVKLHKIHTADIWDHRLDNREPSGTGRRILEGCS